MKKYLLIVMIAFLTIGSSVASAAKDEKGASAKAYEHADDQAIFNRTADWFATLGKSGEEKEAALAERKAKRAAKRAEKEAREKTKQLEGDVDKAKDQTKDKAKKMKKSAEKDMQKMKGKMKKGS